jgi:hypothetical protein
VTNFEKTAAAGQFELSSITLEASHKTPAAV